MSAESERLDELLLVERVLARAMRDSAACERLARAGVTEAEVEVVEHRVIVRCMLACFGESGSADMALVEERLRRAEGWEPAKARSWLSAIAKDGGEVPLDDQSFSACLERLRHLAALRRVKALADRMRSMADADKPAGEIAAEAGGEIEAIVLGSASRRMHSGKALAQRFIKRLSEPQMRVERIPTGIPAVDKATRGGVRRGLTLMLGANMSTGKTTYAAHMLLSALTRGPAAYFSLEIPADPFFDALMEMNAGKRIELDIDRFDGTALVGAAADPRLDGLWIDDGGGGGMTAEEIAAKIHALAKSKKIKSAFVDYGQIIEHTTRFKRDDLNFGHVSHVLRRAFELADVAGFVVVQMAAQEETSRGRKKKQTEEHAADSRAFGKDASYAMIADRDRHSEDVVIRNVTKLALTKNRPEKDLVTCHMRYNPKTTEIYPCDAKGERITTVDVVDEEEQPAYLDEWDQALAEAERDNGG